MLRVVGDEARGEQHGEGGGVDGAEGGDCGESVEEGGEGVDGDGAAEPAAEDGPVLGRDVGFQELEGLAFGGAVDSEGRGFWRDVVVAV